MVAVVDPSNVECHLQSSKCYEALNQSENAINALDLALVVMGKLPEFRQVRDMTLEHQNILKARL